jgi:hypothetical protein
MRRLAGRPRALQILQQGPRPGYPEPEGDRDGCSRLGSCGVSAAPTYSVKVPFFQAAVFVMFWAAAVSKFFTLLWP